MIKIDTNVEDSIFHKLLIFLGFGVLIYLLKWLVEHVYEEECAQGRRSEVVVPELNERSEPITTTSSFVKKEGIDGIKVDDFIDIFVGDDGIVPSINYLLDETNMGSRNYGSCDEEE